MHSPPAHVARPQSRVLASLRRPPAEQPARTSDNAGECQAGAGESSNHRGRQPAGLLAQALRSTQPGPVLWLHGQERRQGEEQASVTQRMEGGLPDALQPETAREWAARKSARQLS